MAEAPRDEDAEGAPPAPRPASPARPARAKDAPSDVAAIVDDLEEEHAAGEPLDPRRAYEVLEIRTPLEEFESYVRARIDTLSRLGETEKAELATQALELGRRALARVTGTGGTTPPASEKAPR
jgi:hypothetical protein